MSRRRVILTVLSLVLLIAATALVWLLWPDPEDRVIPGMKMAEVEAIFGGRGQPPRREGVGTSWVFRDRTVTVRHGVGDTADSVRVDGVSRRLWTRAWIRQIASGYFTIDPIERTQWTTYDVAADFRKPTDRFYSE